MDGRSGGKDDDGIKKKKNNNGARVLLMAGWQRPAELPRAQAQAQTRN